MSDWSAPLLEAVAQAPLVRRRGRILQIVGLVIESSGPTASIGELCDILEGVRLVCRAEVVGFREGRTLVMPLGPMEGIRPGMIVEAGGHQLSVGVGPDLLGRVVWPCAASTLRRRIP